MRAMWKKLSVSVRERRVANTFSVRSLTVAASCGVTRREEKLAVSGSERRVDQRENAPALASARG